MPPKHTPHQDKPEGGDLPKIHAEAKGNPRAGTAPPRPHIPPPPDHSILHQNQNPGQRVIKKGVGFDPAMKAHDLEDSNKKGHSKQQQDNHLKKEEEIDLSGERGKHVFCRNLHSSLLPLNILLKIVGRFPLTRYRSQDHKTYEYTVNCASMGVLYFNIVTVLLFYALLMGLWNVTYLMLDLPLLRKSFKDNEIKAETVYKTQLSYDKALIQRNAIPLIIVFTVLLQACISSILITRKHDYLAHIFSFLNKAAYTLHMDLGENAKDFSVQSTVIFTIVTCIFVIFSCLKFGPSSIGTPTVFGSLMLRVFLGIGNKRVWLDPENANSLRAVQIIGGVFLVIIYTSSIAPILLFTYKCKIVRNAFAFWNGRAYCALLRGTEYAQTEEARTTYNLLFKDHCILLDLLDSIDQMYSLTLESFFALQVVSFFFQMYFFYRTGTQTKYSTTSQPVIHKSLTYMRPYDWLPVLVILFATSAILFTAGRAAAKVAEEAEAGAEVIRRKGVLGRRTDQELEFLHSMCFSFQSYKKPHISGAGYLYYNKGFIVQLIAVSLFCLLLLCQFRPLLDYAPDIDITKNQTVGRFLRKIEGASDHMSQWINSEDDREWALGF